MEENAIVLRNEDGDPVKFIVLDLVELNGATYVVLLPDEDEELSDRNLEEDEEEVLILRVNRSAGNRDTFEPVDDDDILNAVLEEFLAQNEEELAMLDDVFFEMEEPEE